MKTNTQVLQHKLRKNYMSVLPDLWESSWLISILFAIFDILLYTVTRFYRLYLEDNIFKYISIVFTMNKSGLFCALCNICICLKLYTVWPKYHQILCQKYHLLLRVLEYYFPFFQRVIVQVTRSHSNFTLHSNFRSNQQLFKPQILTWVQR